LATNDHFSSNWTSRASGGKGHQLVVGGLGVIAGEQGQSGDRVLVDPDQPGGLTDAAAVGQMLQDGQDLLMGEPGVEQRGALELGGATLARVAIEQSVEGLAKAAADREVAGVTFTESGATWVMAAEASEVVGRHEMSQIERMLRISSSTLMLSSI